MTKTEKFLTLSPSMMPTHLIQMEVIITVNGKTLWRVTDVFKDTPTFLIYLLKITNVTFSVNSSLEKPVERELHIYDTKDRNPFKGAKIGHTEKFSN